MYGIHLIWSQCLLHTTSRFHLYFCMIKVPPAHYSKVSMVLLELVPDSHLPKIPPGFNGGTLRSVAVYFGKYIQFFSTWRSMYQNTGALHRVQINLKYMYSIGFHNMHIETKTTCFAMFADSCKVYPGYPQYVPPVFQVHMRARCYSLISADLFKKYNSKINYQILQWNVTVLLLCNFGGM